ncbi:ABC transporter permease [Desulfocurvus sp. DL9XJH121]
MSLRIVRRTRPLPHKGLVTGLLALFLALLTGAVVFLGQGVNPLTAYATMASGALGSLGGLAEVAVKAVPLTLTGLSVALAATMLLWNIGAEGQFVWGVIGAGWAALYAAPHLPAPLVLPACLVCGALAGAAWAAVPAALKVRFGVSEILSTLLLNYVAIIFMEHLYFGPWRDPMAFGFPGTPIFPESAWLPRLGRTRLHLGAALAVLAPAALHVLLTRTKWGLAVRVAGHSPRAARHAGLGAGRLTFAVLALAGALAGLAGVGEVCGIHYVIREGVNPGYGYDGIIVACLAGLKPLLVPVYALVLGAFLIGADRLQSVMQLPASIGMVLEGALLLGLLAAEALTRFTVVRGQEDAAEGGDA